MRHFVVLYQLISLRTEEFFNSQSDLVNQLHLQHVHEDINVDNFGRIITHSGLKYRITSFHDDA